MEPTPEQAARQSSKDYARKKVAKAFQDSKLVDQTSTLPQFDKSEVTMGKILGVGAFSVAREIPSFNIQEKITQCKPKKRGEEDPQVQHETRLFIARHCIRGAGFARYAVKSLSKKTLQDPVAFENAIYGMGIETRFLSSLDEHPNIIKMRAIACKEFVDEDYFLVLDRLYDTLLERIDKWKVKQKRLNSRLGKLKDRKGHKAVAFLEERLVAALDVCGAIEYLHANHILHRDIKSDNIGFDVRGDIKLFDFGLAREINIENRLADGTYHLTPCTGCVTFMAPEVSLGKTYSETCDVYSMAILMYHMLALQFGLPYDTPETYRERVHVGGERPVLKDVALSKEIKTILEKGWHVDHVEQRPTMHEFARMVKDETMRVRGDEDSGFFDQTARSNFSVVLSRNRRLLAE